MSGVEVGGLALELLEDFMIAFRLYHDLLRVSEGIQSPNISNFRIQILAERARFESWIQLLSKMKVPDKDVLRVIENAQSDIQAEFSTLTALLGRPQNSKWDRVRFAFVDKDKVAASIKNLQQLNDRLFTNGAFLALLEVQGFLKERHLLQGYESQRGSVTDLVERPVRTPGRRTEKIPQIGHLFRNLVRACHLGLKNLSGTYAIMHDASLAYQLWAHAIESEDLFTAMTMSQSGEANTGLSNTLVVQVKAVSHIARILLQTKAAFPQATDKDWSTTLSKIGEEFDKAKKIWPWLSRFSSDELSTADKEPEELRLFATKEIHAMLKVLQRCLPSVIDFARSHSEAYNPASEDIIVEPIGELIDVSVELLKPATTALETATASGRKKDCKGNAVSYEDIYSVFRKQAEALNKWQEKYRRDIEERLALRNPAKRESIAEAVCNITHILNSLPTLADPNAVNPTLSAQAQELLTNYSFTHPTLSLPRKIHRPENLSNAVQSLETYVQSLVVLEEALDLVDPPPPYSEKVIGSGVVLDMEGRVAPRRRVLESLVSKSRENSIRLDGSGFLVRSPSQKSNPEVERRVSMRAA